MITELQQSIQIPANTEKTIIVDQLTTTTIDLQANAKLTFIAILREGQPEKPFLTFNHLDPGATTIFIAIIIANNSSEFAFETISNHEAPHTNAYYYTRAVQYDQSKVFYRGQLNVKPAAQVTDSYLAHHTLMLSPDARTETIPSLEIEADDVKAGHAATIGQVDEETLHYMQSRGLSRKDATEMMIEGFLQADFHHLSSEETRLETTRKLINIYQEQIQTNEN